MSLSKVAVALILALSLSVAARAADAEWLSLFDGETLAGWTEQGAAGSFTVQDGAIVAQGKPVAHLFYTGDAHGGDFKNFDLRAEVLTGPKSNSGIYFHTKMSDSRWPKHGYEVQVNNTHGDPVKTGSLYETVKVFEAPAQDNEWFVMEISVRGKQVTVKVDGKTVVDYAEPADKQPGKDFTRVVDHGTFALQAHDPGSVVKFRSIQVRPAE